MIKWENEKELLEKLINEGSTYEHIGKLYGCTGANIKKQAKKLGIKLPKRREINAKETFNKGKRKYNSNCANCGSSLEKNQKKYCSQECEIEYHYKENVSKWKNGKISGCDKNGSISSFVRKYLFEKVGYKCEKCGFNEVNQYTGLPILQIHHIDGNCFNNSEENLVVLCPNHHALTENFGSRNKNSTRIDRRTKYYRNIILKNNKEN